MAAVDPRSGEVLTLCSNPTYDAGQFLGGISRKEFAALNSDPGKPLLNRAIYSAYAPGSTFKIVTTIAAMQTGHFSPTQTFFCPGYYRMGRRNFKCLGNHGAVAFERAMAKSCNTYFISLGMKAGPEAIQRACADLGLGKPTGVDLLGEGKGFVPSMDNIDRWSADGKWWPGDTANFSVGQGAMAVTPLQMASVIALVANRGISYRPHLVRAVVEPGDQVMKPVQPQVLGRVEASDAFWSTLQRGVLEHAPARTRPGHRRRYRHPRRQDSGPHMGRQNGLGREPSRQQDPQLVRGVRSRRRSEDRDLCDAGKRRARKRCGRSGGGGHRPPLPGEDRALNAEGSRADGPVPGRWPGTLLDCGELPTRFGSS